MAKTPKRTKSSDRTFLDLAMKRLKRSVDADKHNRENAISDLEFINGDQWSSDEKQRREDAGRPALQINLLPKFVNQVKGDMIQNQPAIKIVPSDTASDTNIAKIRQGIILEIESNSDAESIYGQAATQAVSCGYGAWRVLTRHTEENPFMQEIYLESIPNPFQVYLDPSAKDHNSADGGYGFILTNMPKDEFETKYPGKTSPTNSMGLGTEFSEELWLDDDTITVAEYFVVSTEQEQMHQLQDGRVVSQEEFDALLAEHNNKMDDAMSSIVAGGVPTIESAPVIISSKMADKKVVDQYIITAYDVISGPHRVAGKFIPIVSLKGRELNIKGKTYRYGLVKDGKDPQKMVNYWNSSAAETISQAPKTPWIGTAKQFEGYEGDYAASNVDNAPFLKYNADPDAQGPPQRVPPSSPPTAIFEQIRRGEENIKSVIGMFNADVGAGGSEQTGVAIAARQRPGDIGTYDFVKNYARAIQYTGRIINSMIPSIYDTERNVKVRGIDGSETFVPINTTVSNAAKSISDNPSMFQGIDTEALTKFNPNDKYNDVTSGKFEVVVTVGPSYSTQRQESAQHLLELTRAMPEQLSAAADLIVKNLDFKDSDELAKRLRVPLIAQGLVTPRPDDIKPPQQQGPTPEQQIQMALVKVEESKVAVNELKAQNEAQKIQMEELRIQRDIVADQLAMAKMLGDAKHRNEKADRDFMIDQTKLRKEILSIMKEIKAGNSQDV